MHIFLKYLYLFFAIHIFIIYLYFFYEICGKFVFQKIIHSSFFMSIGYLTGFPIKSIYKVFSFIFKLNFFKKFFNSLSNNKIFIYISSQLTFFSFPWLLSIKKFFCCYSSTDDEEDERIKYENFVKKFLEQDFDPTETVYWVYKHPVFFKDPNDPLYDYYSLATRPAKTKEYLATSLPHIIKKRRLSKIDELEEGIIDSEFEFKTIFKK